jgi:hypothetical protein
MGVLKLHTGLREAESSVLVQTRTSRMGLAKFLYNHKVPGIESAKCRCGAGEEATRTYGPLLHRRNRAPPAPPDERTSQLPATNRNERMGQKVLRVDDLPGRLGQFSPARRLLYGKIGSSEAAYFGVTDCEGVHFRKTAGKVFIPPESPRKRC